MTKKFKTSDGVTLSLIEQGSGNPMVFQHGLCGDAQQPGQVFPIDAGHQRITLECRGHGGSMPGSYDKFSIATFTNDVADMIAAICNGPVVIGGISLGAAIALRLAVTRPAIVKALVIARPAWLVEAAPDNIQPNAIVGNLLKHHAPEDARRLFETLPLMAHLAKTAPDNLASLRGFFSRSPLTTTAELLTRISADGPGVSEAEIRALKIPTLVIGHDRDFVHPMTFASALAQLIPNAEFCEITPKANDVNAYVQDFRATLSQFLKGL